MGLFSDNMLSLDVSGHAESPKVCSVHFPLESDVVLVERVVSLGRPTGPGFAEPSEGADALRMGTVLSGALDSLNQRFAPQLGQILAGLLGNIAWPGVWA